MMITLSEADIERAKRMCLRSYEYNTLLDLDEDSRFEVGNICGYFHYLHKRINDKYTYLLEVVFTGSNDWEDWLVNLNFAKSQYGIHRGWWNSYRKVKKTLDQILKMYAADTPLLVYGHSAGGALAGIFALFHARKRPVYLITFGQPKFCSSKLGKSLESNLKDYVRVVNKLDPIRHLPFGNYQHFGREIIHSHKYHFLLSHSINYYG